MGRIKRQKGSAFVKVIQFKAASGDKNAAAFLAKRGKTVASVFFSTNRRESLKSAPWLYKVASLAGCFDDAGELKRKKRKKRP